MDILRFATAGSVDDGKSTLIGRLLYDSKSIFEDQLDRSSGPAKTAARSSRNLALLTDGLRAEREQGITIDVAYRYFATPQRKFIIADTPGHIQYTRNMVTGASTADLAIVLIDARNGMTEQTPAARLPRDACCRCRIWCSREQDGPGRLRARPLRADHRGVHGVRDQARHQRPDVHPDLALNGDNVVERSVNMPWYDGPSLLHHLEHVHIASDRNLIDVRFPVQYVIRPHQATDRAARLPRLRRPGRRRRAQARRRGHAPALWADHYDQADRRPERTGRRGLPRRCR